MAVKKENRVEVFFDGSCPICRREIDFYMKWKGSNGVKWVDISSVTDHEIIEGLSKEDAISRFHIKNKDGAIESGARAFAVLWGELDSFKIFGKISLIWPFTIFLEILYRVFLKFRPTLQKIAH